MIWSFYFRFPNESLLSALWRYARSLYVESIIKIAMVLTGTDAIIVGMRISYDNLKFEMDNQRVFMGGCTFLKGDQCNTEFSSAHGTSLTKDG